jgi:hypothetical protein
MSPRWWVALVVLLGVVSAVEIYIWMGGADDESPPTQLNPLEHYPHLTPGEAVPAFDVEDPDGRIERIDYSESGKTLLFVLSASCGTCSENLPYWNRIVGEFPNDVRILGLLVGGGESYSYQREQSLIEGDDARFPILRFRNAEDLKRYKVTKVPQTILIGSGGRVEACIMGRLSDEKVDEVRIALGSSSEGTP